MGVVLSNWDSLGFFFPEIALSGLALLAFLADLLPAVRRRRGAVAWLTATGLLAALLLVFVSDRHANQVEAYAATGRVLLFHGMVAYDAFAAGFKVLFLLTGLFAVLLALPAVARGDVAEGEFHGLLATCLLGMCCLATATNLLMIYLAIELVSVPSYLLAGFLRHHRRSGEASLKYVIYGAFASGTMIYGMSFLYGMTGRADLAGVGEGLRSMLEAPGASATTLIAVLAMVLAGFAYKVAAAPFHFWCPDVYEGSPTPVTAFFSVGPKAAGFAALLRFFDAIGTRVAPGSLPWPVLIAIVSVLTMTLGNLSALRQDNLKRLFAYSSIAHAGYLLMGVAVSGPDVRQAVLFYLVAYLFMNLGAFAFVIALEDRFGITTVAGCRGFGWRHGWLGIAMAVFLFSLTGIPPSAGFAGKFLLFGALLKAGSGLAVGLALVGVLNSVVSLFYYARILKALYLEGQPEDRTPAVVPAAYETAVLLFAVPTLVFGVWFDPLLRWTQDAAR